MKKFIKAVVFGFAVSLFFSVSVMADESTGQASKVNIIIDGSLTTFENPPITVDDRTMLPLRDMVKSLGLPDDNSHVIWNENDESITLKDKSYEVRVSVNNNVAYLNSKPITLDVAPIIYNDKTYIPVRFVSQSFGRKVAWDEDSQSILITKEDEYSKVKKILNDASKQFNDIDRFQYQKVFSSAKEDYSIEVIYNVDKKAHKSLGSYTVKSGSNKKLNDLKADEWSQDDIKYQKLSTADTWEWELIEEKDQAATYNILSTLSDNELASAGLVIAEETPAEITLKGDITLKSIFYSNTSSGSLLGGSLNSYLSNNSTVIKIDKKSNSVISAELTLNPKSKVGSNAYVEDSKMTVALKNFTSGNSSELKAPDNLIEVTQEMKNNYLISLGKRYSLLKKTENAINCFDKVLSNDPKNSQALYNKGKVLLNKGDTLEAVKLYDKAVSLDPKLANIYVDLGKKFVKDNDNDQALIYFDKAINAGLKSSDVYFNKGEILYKADKYEEALDCYAEAAKITPSYYNTIENKAFNLGLATKYVASLKYCDKLIELDKDNCSGYLEKSFTLEKMLKYDEALEAVNTAEAIAPNEIAVLTQKFELLKKLKKDDETDQYVDKVLNTEAKTASDYNNKGNLLLVLKRYDEAVECYNKSIQLNPFDTVAYFNKGLALFDLGNYEEASSSFDEAIKINPKYAKAYYWKSNALRKLGKTSEANEYFYKYNQLIKK